MASDGPINSGLITSLYAYLTQNLAPIPMDASLQGVCKAGDLLCEHTDGKRHLPGLMSNIINTSENLTGIDRHISGLAGLGLSGFLLLRKLYQRYNAKTFQDLILNIIKAEFGDPKVALEIFNALIKNIDDAIDVLLDDFLSKFPNAANAQSVNEKAELRNRFSKQVVDRVLEGLKADLQANKEQLLEQAQQASMPLNDMVEQIKNPIPAIPGAQSAPGKQETAARDSLNELVKNNIINKAHKAIVALK